MPGLFFPNLTALRLALSSGLVPAAIARAPAAAGFDSYGRLWLELAELPPRDSLAALSRVGVQVLGTTGIPTEPIRSWAEVLPLNPSSPVDPAGPVLFVLPDRALARFCARLRRSCRHSPTARLHDGGSTLFAWALLDVPSEPILAECEETGTVVEPFIEQAPGIWTRRGWRHPVPEYLSVPPGELLLLRPGKVVSAMAATLPDREPDEFSLPAMPTRVSGEHPAGPTIPVRLRLTRCPDSERETLWVISGDHAAEFWEFCAYSDERVTRRLEVATVSSAQGTRVVVRTTGKRAPIVFPFPAVGFAVDSRTPGLFVPASQAVRPALRARELASVLGITPDRNVWVESRGGAFTAHAVDNTLFSPAADVVEYSAPPVEALAIQPRAMPFALAQLPSVRSEAPSGLPLVGPALPLAVTLPPDPVEAAGPRRSEPGWLYRSLLRLFGRFRAERTQASEPARAEERPRAPQDTVGRKLASPDALLHGHDWAARRRELEQRLFQELPTLGPDGRATRWADLAGVYTTTGNPNDAAVCWMNAVWESPSPSDEWLEQWFLSECRAAKLPDHSRGLERWLSEPGRPGVGRVIAAYTTRAGLSPTPPAELPAALPRVLGFLDHHFDDLPLRAAWLARLAATHLCDGDALGLARWRDRVLSRLAERGPGLDLDEPSFLRFHGTASAERFQTAREWLIRVSEPALAWVRRHGRNSQLQWVGLDAEVESTIAYSQFMMAWGLGCLGERTKAKEWAARARKILTRSPGPHIDPAAPILLGDMFLHRVREAQEGRPSKVGWPPELSTRLDGLAEPHARYSIDRLRQRSRILEPLERVRPFNGLDLKSFWGNDQLGERLFVLAEHPDPSNAGDEAESLLRLCAETPGTATIPRIVLTLLEVSPWLDSSTVLRVIDLLPTAVDWTEAWLAGGRWDNQERAGRLLQRQAQMIEAACSSASSFPPSLAGPAISQLLDRLIASGPELRKPLVAAAGSIFRCLRRLGLRAEADSLMQFLDPGEHDTHSHSTRPIIERLGLATGWFIAGNEDAGNRVLNDAREALYLAGEINLRGRTELAIACTETLGFAPPRIAHGRLEEIFQRLGPVEVNSSTNRYFTLKPLQLIDSVVRSVVTDEFILGSAVRSWLDDDEFLIRGRVHRDLGMMLSQQGIGARRLAFVNFGGRI